MVEIDDELGRLLRKHRTEAGLSFEKLATRAEVSSSLLKKVEAGERSLGVDSTRRLGMVLGSAFLDDAIDILNRRYYADGGTGEDLPSDRSDLDRGGVDPGGGGTD